MTPSRMLRTAIGSVCAAVLLGAGCSDDRRSSSAVTPAPRLEGPVIVGVVGPESGEEAGFGASVVAGAQAAARRVNAEGGIGGHDIQLLHVDDRSDTEQSIRVAQDLIDRRVAAILAAPTGASTFAPIQVVNESGTLFFSIGSRRHLKASGPFVFRVAVPDEAAASDLIRYAAVERKLANFALVSSASDDHSLAMSSMFRRAIGQHGAAIRVEADSYDTRTGERDLDAVVDAIRRAADGLHAVVFTGGAAEAVLLARGLREAGLDLPILGGEELFAPEYLQGGDAVVGTLLVATFSTDSRSPEVARFAQDLGTATPDRFAALAYDTLLLLAGAIRQSGSTDAARVRGALIAREDFVGATGRTGFTTDNQPIKRPLVVAVEMGANGQPSFVLKSAATGG
jgi:branched-chain amino acid transport system substrate-binding protein